MPLSLAARAICGLRGAKAGPAFVAFDNRLQQPADLSGGSAPYADALDANARALDQQEKLVGEGFRIDEISLGTRFDQTLGLLDLHRLNDAPGRVIPFSDLDRGVGERAATVDFGDQVAGRMFHIAEELGIGIVRVLKLDPFKITLELYRDLQPGRYGDIMAVAGDPLKDPSEFGRGRFVMKSGMVCEQDGQPTAVAQ